jgi:hypothetical protein
MPIHMEHGECSKPKMERGATGSVYPSLSSYLGMTDFNLGTTPDLGYALVETSYAPATLRRTPRSTSWTPGMYREHDYPQRTTTEAEVSCLYNICTIYV